MNDTRLFDLEAKKRELLAKYELDDDSLELFRSTIKHSNTSSEDGKKLLELISKKGFIDGSEEVSNLIISGADIEYKNEKKGDFPLIVCARKGYLKTFVVLLRAGANVNQVNNYFTTALMASARHGNAEMVKILIALKADINARCFDGDSALMSAKRHAQKETFNILLKAGAYLNNRNIQNETILDIPGDVGLDTSVFEEKDSCEKVSSSSKVSADQLVDEAYQLIKKFKESI